MLAKTAKGSIKKLTDLVCWCAPKFCVRREEIVMQIILSYEFISNSIFRLEIINNHLNSEHLFSCVLV